jgi:dihydrolipoamide dehydrogenase
MYDLAVIGAGPGGYTAAIRAAQLGLTTVLFEEDNWGGVCLNKGCIPTKAMLKSAEVFSMVKAAGEYGVNAGGASLDFRAVMNRKDSIVRRLTGGVGSLLKMNGVETVKARAQAVSPYCVRAGERDYQTRSIILATGSKPVRVPLPGDQSRLLVSDDVFKLTDLPSSVAIVGGGVIGLEFALMLGAFGVKAAVVELLGSVIAMADGDVIKAARKLLAGSGVEVYENARALESGARGLVCEKEGRRFGVEAEKIILSVGRIPNADIPMLESLGIKHDRGRIRVDGRMRTSVPNIYAVGDINGKTMLAHAASAQGIAAAGSAASAKTGAPYAGKRAGRFGAVPSCIYTSPEIAWVGLTEREARLKYGAVRTSVFPMAANGKSVISGKTEGFVKLVAEPDHNILVGAHLFCDRASDMIAEMVLALNLECCAEEIAESVHPHPTISEACMEAAEGIFGSPIHIFNK